MTLGIKGALPLFRFRVAMSKVRSRMHDLRPSFRVNFGELI